MGRAQVVVLSRADMLAPEVREQIRHRSTHLSPGVLWCEAVHRPQCLIDSRGQTIPLDHLQGQQVAAFCGIGNPKGFRHSLDTLGCEVVCWQEFPDHHDYDAADIDLLSKWSASAGVAVCTRKDLVKLQRTALGEVPLMALQVEVEFLAGQRELEGAVDRAVGRSRLGQEDPI